jgi:hypothetical protein
MKCTICGGRTLPGAKLCLPCRAALRRARDETVSELLPLPRRLEALAATGMSTLSRPIDLIAERRAKRRARKAAQVPSIDIELTPRYPPLRAAAITLFVLAVGVLAYGFTQQLRGDPHTSVVPDSVPAPVPHTSVSPVTLAAEARESALSAVASRESATETPTEQPGAQAVTPRIEAKPRKTAPASSRLPARIEAPTTTAVEVVPMVVAAAPPPPAPRVAPDRWQSLSAALERCTGNLFARIGCEHVARAQYCDGYWGQVAQCPGGVVNDHGQ